LTLDEYPVNSKGIRVFEQTQDSLDMVLNG
jgi:hypothetical protein